MHNEHIISFSFESSNLIVIIWKNFIKHFLIKIMKTEIFLKTASVGSSANKLLLVEKIIIKIGSL